MVDVRLYTIDLYTIGIDEVRDWFGASPDRASVLREIAATTFRVPMSQNRPPGLLGRLGPLMRRDPWAPRIPVDHPSPHDVELLVRGQFVPPERLGQAWRVVEAWLGALASGSTQVSASASDWTSIEFDLARAGLPSQYAVSRLWALDPGLPMRPAAGSEVGYAKHHHAVATREALRAARGLASQSTWPVVDAVLALLDTLDDAAAAASTSGRPVPDVFAVVHT